MRIDLVPQGGTPQAPAPIPTPAPMPPAMANASPSMTVPAPSASSPSPIPPTALAAQGGLVASPGPGAPTPGAPTPVPRKKTPLAGMTVPAPGSGQLPGPIPGVVPTPAPSATAAGRTVIAPPQQQPSNLAAAQRVGSKDLPFSPFDAPTGPRRDSVPPIVSRENVDEDLTERHQQADLRRAASEDADKTVPHSQASLPQSRQRWT